MALRCRRFCHDHLLRCKVQVKSVAVSGFVFKSWVETIAKDEQCSAVLPLQEDTVIYTVKTSNKCNGYFHSASPQHLLPGCSQTLHSTLLLQFLLQCRCRADTGAHPLRLRDGWKRCPRLSRLSRPHPQAPPSPPSQDRPL